MKSIYVWTSSYYNTAQLDFSLNGFCFWLVKPFKRKSSLWWSEQYFCRSLQACSFEIEVKLLVGPAHLTNTDPVDACLSSQLFHHQSLLLDLLEFSLMGKHDSLQSERRVSVSGMLIDQSPGPDWNSLVASRYSVCSQYRLRHTGNSSVPLLRSFSLQNKLSDNL